MTAGSELVPLAPGGPLATTFAAPLVGLWLLRQKITQHIWPVGRWGYYFYPGHLAVLALLRVAL
ncbi:hypothetical protein ACPA9J_14725 [Pseudomonas aeruginosa]